MTREEQGLGALNECDRKRLLQREIASLNAKAAEYERVLRTAADHLSPHTKYTEPEFGENSGPLLQFGNAHFPTLDEVNKVISELGDKRNELFNVSERLKRILG